MLSKILLIILVLVFSAHLAAKKPIFSAHLAAKCTSISDIQHSGIKNPIQFLAVISFESYGCTVLTEIVSKKNAAKYNGGSRYLGRGIIQLTGKYNYKEIGRKIGVNLVDFPELASRPDISLKVAVAFWKLKGLNKQGLTFKYISYRVNGKGYMKSYKARLKVYEDINAIYK